MPSNQKAKIALALALLLSSLTGVAAGLAMVRLYATEGMVRHSYEVELAVGDVESKLAEVGRYRIAYIRSDDPQSLRDFEGAVDKSELAVARVRQLTKDNTAQQSLCDQLEATTSQRLLSSRNSVELEQQKQSTSEKQLRFTYDIAKAAFDTAAITQQFMRNEDNLLEERAQVSKRIFTAIAFILIISFALSACMFWIHYRLLNRELKERRSAENQLRQLSLQLMRVQDEEHRRFARELHDGLGQTLAGAKMMIDALCTGNPGDVQISELVNLLGEAVSQTRTISYLFHPPFLDEIGFASAAKWLIEGYAQRTGVAVSMDIPESEQRLPQSVELALYRVLQEALNNIHRHSRSAKVEVTLQTDSKYVILRVKDDGQGIPSKTLDGFRADSAQAATHAGVGLTGMKERVKEQGGELHIRSSATGTEIVVKIPIGMHIESPDATPAVSVLNAQ
jgi:signal transduction histidine kinase